MFWSISCDSNGSLFSNISKVGVPYSLILLRSFVDFERILSGKKMLGIFNSTTVAKGCVSDIFFKNKSRFRELQPVRTRDVHLIVTLRFCKAHYETYP